MSQSEFPRYAPTREFPPYAFLPGRDPHPTRDPNGHSFTESPEAHPPFHEPEDWAANEEFRFGVDLYNFGYLWEAHEAWEGVWIVSKHDDLQRETLQGLIQCSAAALKLRLTEPRGFAKLSTAGLRRLKHVCGGTEMPFMGLNLRGFVDEFSEFAESAPTDSELRPRLALLLS